MGAGLRENIGPTWGPQVWRKKIDEHTSILVDAAKTVAKKFENDRKRKSTEKSKESRKKSKYTHTDESVEARKSYSRHDGGIEPEDISEDISREDLGELSEGFYNTHVVVSEGGASPIYRGKNKNTR